MKSFLGFFILLTAITSSGYGQSVLLSGKVTDENNLPLPGAAVWLMPGKKGVITNAEGNYLFEKIQKGRCTINISFLGYKTETKMVNIQGNEAIDIQLFPMLQTLQEVEIKDNYLERIRKEDARNIEVVNDVFLKQNLGGSLMKSLERLPGVSTIEIGSGQSKPVIRGLGFNRVVVVENGIKHEGQQWGADHGLEIDQFAVEQLEVIKGPASLMYGSDAIGGIIELKQFGIPSNNTIGGSIDMTGKSNNNLIGSSVSVFTRKSNLYLILRATILDYADFKVPTDSIDIYSFRAPLYNNEMRNTAGMENNFHASFGIVKTYFLSRFFVSRVHSKNGFFANAHGLEPRRVDVTLHDRSARDIHYPYQEVTHFKAINRTEWMKGNLHIESEFGFQHNFRQEMSQYVNHGYMPPLFPNDMPFPSDLERQFDKYIYSANLKAVRPVNDKMLVTSGLSMEHQNNRIDGRGFMIPAFKQYSGGAFIYGKYSLSGNSLLHLGVRYDFGAIDISPYNDWFESPNETENGMENTFLQRAPALSRNFSSFTWAAGFNYNLEKLLLKVNFGKSFRMPIAKELAANGVNYHHFSYEVGNPDLSPEIAYQLDIGTELTSKYFAIGITPFLNYFSNYIYLNPSSEHDQLYGNGNQIFHYTQSKVLRFGGEIHAHFDITKSLKAGMIGEYVYSEQLSGDKKGFTLPFSPPASVLLHLKFVPKPFYFIDKPYLSIDYKLTASQNQIVPPEEKSKGYQVVNLGFGAEIHLKKQPFTLNFQIQNMLNQKYYNHMSYYRLINVPEPGRSFILNVSIPFSYKIGN